SLIEHDAIVGDHTHVAPGALVLGDAQVGADTFVGAGSVIRQGITVGDRVTVGAGAVVIGAVRDDLVVTGVPARPLNRPIG
ncbi:MAG: DapH/DapD/GlmU-related protein, partial [Planctomycetota bacterium]